MSGNIIVRPLRRDDITEVCQVIDAAFRGSEIYGSFAPRHQDLVESIHKWGVHRLRERIVTPTKRLFVAEESDSGRIVGYAAWSVMGDPPLKAEWVREASRWWMPFERQLLALEEQFGNWMVWSSVDHAVLADFRRDTILMEDKGILPRDQLHLHTLTVLPECQGKGVGKALMQCGFKIADRNGLPVTLQSSIAGVPVYEAVGFKVEDYLAIAPGRAGREYLMPVLMRPVQPQSSS